MHCGGFVYYIPFLYKLLFYQFDFIKTMLKLKAVDYYTSWKYCKIGHYYLLYALVLHLVPSNIFLWN